MLAYEENEIIANKQNPQRSGTEQAADLAKVFKLIKMLQQTYTVSNLPANRSPMKQIVAKVFADLYATNKLNLASNKRNSLIDFLSCLPAMIIRAATHSNIQAGFTTSGVIDEQEKRYPDFNKMFATYRRNPTEDEYKNYIKQFTHLLRVYKKDGYADDDTFEQLSFIQDHDIHNNIVHGDATINQESRQHAKCLTHPHQQLLRQEREDKMQAEIKQRSYEANAKVVDKFDSVNEVVKKLCLLQER